MSVRLPALFRRREVWVPTPWGLLLIVGAVAALIVAFALNAYAFLSPHQPALGRDGRGAHTLVIEGWMPEAEVAQAIPFIRAGHYDRVLTTGPPINPLMDYGGWHTYAARAAAVLRRNGIAEPLVTTVDSPTVRRDRTYTMAVSVRDWAARSNVQLEAIDLFSVGVHTRRSRMTYRLALGPEVEVGTVVAWPIEYDPSRWWASSEGARATLYEFFGLAWTACCIWP
ncbi:MAG TPA: hypothetical protein VGM74_23210 [Burkholderiaceae bacterium]